MKGNGLLYKRVTLCSDSVLKKGSISLTQKDDNNIYAHYPPLKRRHLVRPVASMGATKPLLMEALVTKPS